MMASSEQYTFQEDIRISVTNTSHMQFNPSLILLPREQVSVQDVFCVSGIWVFPLLYTMQKAKPAEEKHFKLCSRNAEAYESFMFLPVKVHLKYMP